MIKLGICNELFEGWDFARVCRTVKGSVTTGWRLLPSPWLLGSLTLPAGQPPRTPHHGGGCRARDDRPALAAREDGGVLSHLARRRRSAEATGDYLIALAEATRDLGGSLMVLGSPKQRDLLARRPLRSGRGLCGRGFHPDHAGPGGLGVDLCLEPLAPSETNFLNTCAQAMP